VDCGQFTYMLKISVVSRRIRKSRGLNHSRFSLRRHVLNQRIHAASWFAKSSTVENRLPRKNSCLKCEKKFSAQALS
jgi:hypothetical protein